MTVLSPSGMFINLSPELDMAASSSSTRASAKLRASHLRARVLVDLVELREQPLPGFTVHFDDEDTTKLCLVVTPVEGYLAGLRLHFDVEVPAEFPLAPVRVATSTRLIHPNVFGKWICLDILKNEEQMQSYRGGNYNGGSNPGYSLQGIFHQIASFFSTDIIPQSGGAYSVLSPEAGQQRRDITVENLRHFHCKRCPFPSMPIVAAEVKAELTTMSNWPKPTARHIIAPTVVGFSPGSSLLQPGRVVVGAGLQPAISKSRRRAERRRQAKEQHTSGEVSPVPSTSSLPAIANSATIVEAIASIAVTKDDAPIKQCHLERLDADILLYLFAILNTTDLLSLAAAYPFAAELVASANVVAAREIRCFVTKKTAGQTLLGIGLRWNAQLKGLESSFDWLSREAWTDLEIRMGLRREQFTHWLPMAIHDGHFSRARKEIVTRLKEIERKLVLGPGRGGAGKREPSIDGYRALCSFANEIVLRLMKTANEVIAEPEKSPDESSDEEDREDKWFSGCGRPECPRCSLLVRPPPAPEPKPKSKPKAVAQSPAGTLLHASEKALCDFVSVIHLAVSLAVANPAIANDAARSVHRFIQYPNVRRKEQTPDLGELLIQLVLCPNVGWTDFRGPFLQESFTRQVVWMLDSRQGKGHSALALLESDPVSEWRLKTSFEAGRTSLRLAMFQHAFLSQLPALCGKRKGERLTLVELKEGLDARFGLPPRDMPGRLVQQIQDIYAVDNYASFSARLGLRSPSKQWMTQYLRDRVNESAKSGYHNVPVTRNVLLNARLLQDKRWADRTPERRAVRNVLGPGDARISKSFFPSRY